MTAHEAPLLAQESGMASDAGQLAQLCAVIDLVEQMAGEKESAAAKVDDRAIARAYRIAPAVARRRFDRLLREAAAIATAGVEALIAAGASPHGAAKLAATLRCDLGKLARIVG